MFYRQYQDNGGFGRGDEIVVLADRDGFRPRHRSSALSPRGNTPSTAILICINYLCMRASPALSDVAGMKGDFSSRWLAFETFMDGHLQDHAFRN